MQNFQALGALPPDPQNSPPNCEFLATRLPHFAMFIIIRGWGAFVLNNFFFIVQLQTLYDVNCSCMLNCFLVEKFYLHYAVCDFDSILLHCTKLFICQSTDREQIFDVTFETPPLKNPAYATGYTHVLSTVMILSRNVGSPWLYSRS